MAISASTVFECNASATAGNVNGGGFNPANANTINDGVIASGTGASPTLTSATYTFVSGDIGAWVYFKTQTNMVNCFAQIASVSGGVATLTAGAGTLNIPNLPDWTTNTNTGVATTAAPTGVSFLVDYSRSTAARQSWTNLSTVTTSTTITDSSSGGFFTKAMAGNLICISSGTNATVSWYEIVSVTDTNNAVLDASPGSSLASGHGSVGGAISLNGSTAGITDANFFQLGATSTTSAPQFFILQGNYTLAASPTIIAGNLAYCTQCSGYASIRGDSPTGTTRPTLNCGTNVITKGAEVILKYIIIKGSGTNVVTGSGFSKTYNCAVFNTSTTASRTAFTMLSTDIIDQCELISYNGTAVAISSSSTGAAVVTNCYIHDSRIGISDGGTNTVNVYSGNLIVGVTTAAFSMPGAKNCSVLYGNTLYGFNSPVISGASGINFNSANATPLVKNNIICYFGTGAQMSGNSNNTSNVLANYNNYFGNTTDKTFWTEGANSIANDPSFTSVTVISGSTATTSSTTLTDAGKNFTSLGVVAGRDYLYVSANTGGTTGIYGITAVGSTTITTDNSLGTGSSTTYQIITGRNFLPIGNV